MSLNRRPQDYIFREYFDPRCLSVNFLSLAKDSTLISPCPPSRINQKPNDIKKHYVHLATFVKNGPMEKVKDVLKESARIMLEKLNTTPDPWWFSTSGNGVAWLHVRVDPRPKYYQYNGYKTYDNSSFQGNSSFLCLLI